MKTTININEVNATKCEAPKSNARQTAREVQQTIATRELTRAEFIQRLCPELPVFDDTTKYNERMMGELPAFTSEYEKQKHIQKINENIKINQTGANECVNLVLSLN